MQRQLPALSFLRCLGLVLGLAVLAGGAGPSPRIQSPLQATYQLLLAQGAICGDQDGGGAEHCAHQCCLPDLVLAITSPRDHGSTDFVRAAWPHMATTAPALPLLGRWPPPRAPPVPNRMPV